MNVLEKHKILYKNAKDFGFEWPHVQMILDHIMQEWREVHEAIDQGSSKEKLQEEIGDLLQATLFLCTFCACDVEALLEKAHLKFLKRFKHLKALVNTEGLEDLKHESIQRKLDFWKKAKDLCKEK